MKDLCRQLTPSNIWEMLDRNNRFKATIIVNFSSGDVIRIIFGFTEYVSFQINPLVSVFLCLVLLQLQDHETSTSYIYNTQQRKTTSSIHLSFIQPKGEVLCLSSEKTYHILLSSTTANNYTALYNNDFKQKITETDQYTKLKDTTKALF